MILTKTQSVKRNLQLYSSRNKSLRMQAMKKMTKKCLAVR